MATSKNKQTKAGTPIKLNSKRLEKAKQVIEEDQNEDKISKIIIFTDQELVQEVNDRLIDEGNEKYTLGNRTFQRYKAGDIQDKSTEEVELMAEFRRIIEKALRLEKNNLFDNMKKDEKAWQKWAWIIERKFDEWNLKKKIDEKQTVEGEMKHNHNHKVDFKNMSAEEIEERRQELLGE